MFAVDNLDDRLTRLRKLGAQLVGEVVKYEDVYRLCYIRGPEGLLIGLAEELAKTPPDMGNDEKARGSAWNALTLH